jgi:acetylornithine deacetylase/succinyl-diaminopimelate desuccinylase-like protein
MSGTILEILKVIDEDGLIQILEDLVRIPSPTGEEEAISNLICSYAQSNGFTSIQRTSRWDVVARIDGEQKGPRLLFLTHLDHSCLTDDQKPYDPKILDGKDFGKLGKVVVGRGSCSPKGTIASMLCAGKVLAVGKEKLKGSLIIAAVGRDLLANHDGIREVAERGWIDADMAIAGEPTGNQPIISARGINQIEITVSGVSSHWGKPEDGINPIWNLPQVLKVLQQLIQELPSHKFLKKATLAPIDIRCDMSPPRTPTACYLILDRRTLPGEDSGSILKIIEERLGELELKNQKIYVNLKKQMYPFEGNPMSFISQKVSEMHELITGQHVPFGYVTYATNGGFLTSQMKIPTLVYGPGRIEDMAPREHVEVNRLIVAAKVYAGTACEVLQEN